MGNANRKKQNAKITEFKRKAIGNKFESKEQLNEGLRNAGFEGCNLLVAIDMTKSNEYTGQKTFNGKSLHHIQHNPVNQPISQSVVQPAYGYPPVYDVAKFDVLKPSAETKTTNEQPPLYRAASIGRSLSFHSGDPKIADMKEYMDILNPYQYILSVAGNQLDEFDTDKIIPTIIFGHDRPADAPYVKEIGPLGGCYKIDGVIAAYENALSTHNLGQPTLFAPVIKWAVNKVRESQNCYHILLIIGDGVVNDFEATKEALATASKYPLSVVFCGVGDGSDPENKDDKWYRMRELDDNPSGDVDNWQSIYISNMQHQLSMSKHPDLDLVTQMMMEIPEQYDYFNRSGKIGSGIK